MTSSAFPVNESDGDARRAERLLDSAAELLVRWGYQRVTIDDVARHAGVGKGTVYLHFRTKDALFLTVLLRAHRRIFSAIAGRMRREPGELLPSRMVRASYLDVHADPVGRLLYLGDPEVLGRLTHEAAASLGELAERRTAVMREYFLALRAAGCLRTDLDVDAQLHIMNAVGVGFFTADSSAGDVPVEARAELLAHTIAAAIEVPAPDAAALARVAPRIVDGMQELITIIDQEWRRRVR